MRRASLVIAALLGGCGQTIAYTRAPLAERVPVESLGVRLTPPRGLRINKILRDKTSLLIDLRPADRTAAYWAPRPNPLATDTVDWTAYQDTAFVRLVLEALRLDNTPTPAEKAYVWAWVSPYQGLSQCWSTRTGLGDRLKPLNIRKCLATTGASE